MRRRRFLALALAGGVGLAAGGCGLGDDSVQEHVEDSYKRNKKLDVDGAAIAYTSSKGPDKVEKSITKQWRSLDRTADATGVYLRYPEHVVTVQPNGAGSVVRVEGVRTAYPRYRDTVGATWGWHPTGTGESARGGGPGSGK